MQLDHQQTVTLTGSAARGIGPQIRELAALPLTVRLGRIRPAARPAVLRLASYLDVEKAAAALPPATHRRDRAVRSLSHMYLNDREGDCVVAGKLHTLGLWSANDSDSAGEIVATDQEAHSQYVSICGPGDRGCVITQVMDVFRSRGLVAGGRTYKIDGYVAIDHTNEVEVKLAIFLFGSVTLGINLPSAWTTTNVWDLTNTQIVGGHDVPLVDFSETGYDLASWARLYRMTPAALTDRRWVEEAYVMLGQSWYGNDQLAPSGVKVAELKADLDKLAHGVLPDLPDVTPPAPPPPAGDYHYTLAVDRATGRPSITQVLP